MNVIINADDLGLSHEVNTCIEHFMEKGAISSSTILANGEAFHSVPEIVKRHPSISYGVHLNLTEFNPLTNAGVFRSYGMINENGSFIRNAIRTVPFTKELKEAIYEEWSAQLQRILNAGIPVTHIDGHHHCQTQYELYAILRKLAYHFGIRRVRQNYVYPLAFMRRRKLPAEPISLTHDASETSAHPQPAVNFRKRFVTAVRNRIWYCRTMHDFETADLFFAYEDFIKRYDLIRRKKSITIELMCHPGNPLYKEEADLLMKNTMKKPVPFTLITYKVV